MTEKDKEGLEVLLYGLCVGSAVVGVGAILINNNFASAIVFAVVSYGFYKAGKIVRHAKK